jgi:hypothetical protein
MADEISDFFNESNRNSEKMQSFGIRLHQQFELNKAYRRPKELEWLEDLRQYKGLYDPDVRIEPDCSHVYPKMTRSKVNIVLSKLHEMLFPELDRNYEVTCTPEPKLNREVVMGIATSLIKQPPVDPQTGQIQIDPQTNQPMQPIPPTPDELKRAMKYYAQATAEKMQSEMDDQLLEMEYPEETKKVLRSGLLYGTGILGGPLIERRTKREWKQDDITAEYIENNSNIDVPYMKFVRIWDWYPDMSVTDYKQASGFFERSVMTKHDIRGLMKRPDFYKDVIEQFLTDHPDGDYVPESWEVDLQNIEVQASSKEERTVVQTSTTGNTDALNRTSYRQGGKKYEVLQFWGYIDGEDLEACGVTRPDGKPIDISREYAAHVWLLGKNVIKSMLFEGALDHYKIFYYEKDETSIFGEGLTRVIRHSQIAISSAARMVLDNGACVSGPQVEVNWSLLHDGTDLNSFYPRKIWYRDGKDITAQYPAVRSITFDSHITELISIITLFTGFSDQESCLPTWLISEQVNNENAKQTSGKQSTITASIKDVVKNFDTFTEHVMRDLYAWNMEFNPRQDIKGDFQCKPRGVSSLVMKEIRMAALTNLKNTLQPEDWAYIPRREFLSETFKSHDVLIDLRTDEEAQEYTASQTDKRAMELGYNQLEADIAYKRAQAAGQLTKAKKLNTEAEKDARTPIETPPSDNPELQNAEVMGKNMETLSKAEQIRRDEENHQLEMQHKHEQHQAGLITDAAKTANDMQNKKDLTNATVESKKNSNKGIGGGEAEV